MLVGCPCSRALAISREIMRIPDSSESRDLFRPDAVPHSLNRLDDRPVIQFRSDPADQRVDKPFRRIGVTPIR